MLKRALPAAVLVACLAAAPQAQAAPDCPGGPFESRTLASEHGTLESVIVHPNGKLYFTNPEGLLRLDAPGAEPVMHAVVDEPGGLAVEPDGSILMGAGNTIPNGTMGNVTGPATMVRIDPVSGKVEHYASGLSMGNGVDRGPDGSVYASNDFGSNIDRIREGKTERGWAKVESGNGVVVDSTGKWLYVAQTFRPAAIQRVEIANPQNVTPFAVVPPEDASAGFDGMDRDAADNLYVAANGAGSVWKASPKGELCVLLRGLPPFPGGPSAVSVGVPGSAFAPENLYVVAFNGALTEIARVAVAPSAASRKPVLSLRVRPRKVRAGRRVRFRLTVTSSGAPVPRARVRIGGKRASTNASGKARITHRFRRRGRYRARASKQGFASQAAPIRVTRR